MQYAAATANNARTAGGSVGRQGQVNFELIFKYEFSFLFLCTEISTAKQCVNRNYLKKNVFLF